MKLTARDWYTITNRGRCASIDGAQLPPGPSDGSDLLNQKVEIDGREYLVVGVEHCLALHGHNERCPKGYGLLVT